MSNPVMQTCAAFILTTVLLIGCSSEETTTAQSESPNPVAAVQAKLSPAATAEAFMQAGNAGDKDALFALMTEKARESLESDDGFNTDNSTFENYTIGETTTTDDGAEVAVEVIEDGEKQDLNFKMREENDAWRVYAMGISLGEGMDMTINFENLGEMLESFVEGLGEAMTESLGTAFDNSFMGGSEEEIALNKLRYEALHALTTDEYNALWKNDVDYSGKTASEALTDLTAALDLTIFEGEHKDLLNQNVSISVQGISKLQAIEEICKELDLYPQFPDLRDSMGGLMGGMMDALGEGFENLLTGDDSPIQITGIDAETESDATEEPALNAVQFIKGARPFPAVFSGPFIIIIDDLQENAPLPTGQISLSVKTYGLDTGQLVLLKDMTGSLEFDGLVDAKNRSLIEENTQYMSFGDVVGSSYTDSYSLPLKNLIREVTEISRFSARQKLILPLEVQEVIFEDIQADQTKSIGDISIKAKSVGNYTQFDITGPEETTDSMKVQFWTKDSEGNDLGITFASADSWQPGKIQTGINTQSPPHTVKMKLVTKSEALEYPVEFKKIPLTKYASTPVRIEELSFEGYEVPLTITYLKITEADPNFAKIQIEITNHSNKDARSASASFEYLDGSGTKLDDFPGSITGTFTAEGFSNLADKGQTTEQDTTAFNMPEATKNIRIVIYQIEFTDGTTWRSQH